MRLLYSLVLYLATPIVLAYFALRGIRDRRYWQAWGQRLAWSRPPGGRGALVVHAASVGEVNAAAPLIEALLARRPARNLLVTTITPTGAARVRELFDHRVATCHLPFDLPGATRRFLRRADPAALIIMETEVWPNLCHSAARAGVPMLIANARLSPASVRSYARFPGLIRPALAQFERILAQGPEDRERFLRCGAPEDRLAVRGNLKFDVQLPARLADDADALRVGWGIDRPVLTAGSTHAGDEAVLWAAFTKVLSGFPSALLVAAPRHPERFREAARAARAAGLNTVMRTETEALPPATQCLLVDTLGELPLFYAAGDVAFIGGTLAPVGGHNVLEAAALARPVLLGPHTDSVGETSARLLATGAARRVRNGEELREAVETLFRDPVVRRAMGQAGLSLVENGRGALDGTLAEIDALLSPGAPSPVSG